MILKWYKILCFVLKFHVKYIISISCKITLLSSTHINELFSLVCYFCICCCSQYSRFVWLWLSASCFYVHVRILSAMRNCDKMSVTKSRDVGPLVFGTCFAIMSADCECSLQLTTKNNNKKAKIWERLLELT